MAESLRHKVAALLCYAISLAFPSSERDSEESQQREFAEPSRSAAASSSAVARGGYYHWARGYWPSSYWSRALKLMRRGFTYLVSR